MAETDTSTGLREVNEGGRDTARRPSGRVDDALKAARGRRKARRSGPRAHFESRHHSDEISQRA